MVNIHCFDHPISNLKTSSWLLWTCVFSCVAGGWCWTPTPTILFLCTQTAMRSFPMSSTLQVKYHLFTPRTQIHETADRRSETQILWCFSAVLTLPVVNSGLFVHLDGNFLAVASHDNFVYIYAVTENGRKHSRVGKCTVSTRPLITTLFHNSYLSCLKAFKKIFKAVKAVFGPLGDFYVQHYHITYIFKFLSLITWMSRTSKFFFQIHSFNKT